MAKISEKFKRCVMSISFQERKKRELIHYKQKKRQLNDMKIDEIELEYINMKTEYEHRKNVLSIFLICIILSGLMDTWRRFYESVEKIIQYTVLSPEHGNKGAEVVFVIIVSLLAIFTAIVFLILIVYMRRMRQMYKKLLIIEEVIKKQRMRIGEGKRKCHKKQNY
jgi:hypothetical protein